MGRPPLAVRWRRCLALVLAAALWGLALPAGVAAREALSQSQVEAVYLFKFASFVTWPESAFTAPTSALVVGVLEDPALAQALAQVAEGKEVGGRPLQVRMVHSAEELESLHVLFIGADARGRAAALIAAVEGRPVLTVSNDPAVHARGTMVNFVVVDQRVRFDIAVAPVRRSRLHMSALMMTAAREVARAEQ